MYRSNAVSSALALKRYSTADTTKRILPSVSGLLEADEYTAALGIEAAKSAAFSEGYICLGEIALDHLDELICRGGIEAGGDSDTAANVAKGLHSLIERLNGALCAAALIKHLESSHIAGTA